MRGGGVKKEKKKGFLAAVLLSALVERFGVSRMRDFFVSIPPSSIVHPPRSLGIRKITLHQL